jgi:hypothetical protein
VVSPWAEIYVEGKRRGSAPSTLSLPAGEHEIRLRNAELGKDETITVEIRPGKTETLRRSWGQ